MITLGSIYRVMGNFMTAANFAEKMNVGVATVNTWVKEGYLDGVEIGGVVYIPADLEVNK